MDNLKKLSKEKEDNTKEILVTTQLTSKKLKKEQIYIFVLLIVSMSILLIGGINEIRAMVLFSFILTGISFIWFLFNRFKVWYNHG